MEKSKIKLSSPFLWQNVGCLWQGCQPAGCQRWVRLGYRWLLAVMIKMPDVFHSLFTGPFLLPFLLKPLHGPASAEKLALSVATPCCLACPCLWRSFRREHLRACLLYVHAVIVLCGLLLSPVLCDQIFKT